MFIYRVSGAAKPYHGTLNEAKDEGRSQGSNRIDLLDIPTDKPGFLRYLNGQENVQRAWMPTKRGGWSEIEVSDPVPSNQPAEVGENVPAQPVVASLRVSHEDDVEAKKARYRAESFAATGIDLEGDDPLPPDPKVEAEVADWRARHPWVSHEERVRKAKEEGK